MLYSDNSLTIANSNSSDGNKELLIKGNGERCRIWIDRHNSPTRSTCLHLTNSKNIQIFCTESKKICKTLGEVQDILAHTYSSEDSNRIYEVTTTRLNVRNKPSKDSEVLGTVARGDKVAVYKFSGKWAKTKYGWISGKHLSPIQATTASSNYRSSNQSKSISSGIFKDIEFARSIPEKYLAKTNSGCALVNPLPKGNESISWTGECKDGFLDGHGELQWFKNGKHNGAATTETIYKGLYSLTKENNSPKMPIIMNTSGKCYFMLPSFYALSNSPIREYFYAQFVGGCKNNKYNKVNIYFNKKLYAVYKGKIYRESLPTEGKLEMYYGKTYKTGSHNGDRYATSKTYQDWIDGLRVISQKNEGRTNLDANDFIMKIGFNSKPTPVIVNNKNILGFSIDLTSTRNSIDLKYDIRPKNKSNLTQNKYIVELEVKITYKETQSMGFIGITDNKVIYDNITIELERSEGYQSSGKKTLYNIKTYLSGLGTKMVKSNFKLNVKVISIQGK